MNPDTMQSLFGLKNKVALVTGGGGVLCRTLCRALGQLGVRVVVVDKNAEAAQRTAEEITGEGGEAIAVTGDVLERASLEAVRDAALAKFGCVDILINGAGGNNSQATISPEVSFFNLPPDAIRGVFELNFIGTLLPCQVFGQLMAEQKEGCILNISSMNAFRPLTRIPAYSAAKAAVSNFTQWLAVHMAQEYSPRIRVNALAPGFFDTEQNHFLLTDPVSGELSPRSRTILAHTPMNRFGLPEDLIGATIWLLSPSAAFITGVVIPVDGGFSAYSGV
jgi:NAD(P)-dependent dehydrogenase (short-subunit alcohol dehydrogenase family)